MAALKQFSRLLYIQDTGKGSLFNKLVWSFTGLFDKVLDKQHKHIYEDFKRSSREMRELREAFDGREQLLKQHLARVQRQYQDFKQQRDGLGKLFMTYKTVNRELMFELEECMVMHRQLREAHQHLKADHMKMLKHLNENGKIREHNQKYFVVNEFNQPEIITHFVEGRNVYEEFQENTLSRKKYIQAELAKYWDPIAKQDLQLDKIIGHELHKYTTQEATQTVFLDIATQEVAIQNYSCKSHVSDISMGDENQFEGFLRKELQDKQTDQTNSDTLVISLRQLYDQVYAENLTLKMRNQRLEETNALENANNERILKEITQLRQQNLWQEAVVKETRLESDGLYKQLAAKEDKLEAIQAELASAMSQLKQQRFNNQIFVKNELELRRKYEKLEKQTAAQIKELESTIKKYKIKIGKAVPVINTYLDLIEEHQDKRHQDVGYRLEEIFKEELNREEKEVDGPFITK